MYLQIRRDCYVTYRSLLGPTIPGQCRRWSNGNEEELQILQSSRAGGSLSDCLMSYIQDTRWERLTPLQRCSRCI